jgi:chemotaxis protein MotB
MVRAMRQSALAAVLGALIWSLGAPCSSLSADSEALQAALQQVKVGEGALTFSSGYITKDEPPAVGQVHRITGDNLAAGNRLLVGAGDLVYVRFFKGETVAVSDYFTLYRRIQDIYHPLRGNYLGELYMIVGVAQVMDISQNLAGVRIVRSYGQITPGDGVMRFAPPPVPQPAAAGRRLPDVPGTIVAVTPQRFLVAQQHVVYIDWGAKDGLVVGDRLDVHRTSGSLPIRKIGELRVLSLEESTGTALIVKSTSSFLRGDRLAIQKPSESGQGATAETLQQELERLSKPAPLQEMPQGALGAPGAPEDLERQLAELARQLEFEEGSVAVKPEGVPVLQQMAGLIKNLPDRHIRIEGHADDKPIGPSLKPKFPSNQELSDARALYVVRALTEQGVDPSALSGVGHADMKPVASNKSEEGRRLNRRIEIAVLPKETAGSPKLPESQPAPVQPQQPPQPMPGLEEAPRVAPPEGSPAPPEKP